MSEVEDYPPTGSYTLSPGEFENLDTPLAWSAGDPTTEPAPHHERHSWRTVAKIAAGIAAAALVLAGAASALASPTPDSHNDWDGKGVTAHPLPTSETPEPPITPFRMPPPREAAHLTHDGAYLQQLRRHGMDVYDPATVVDNAHIICQNMTTGVSRGLLANWMYRSDPGATGLSLTVIRAEIDDAIAAYCPGLG